MICPRISGQGFCPVPAGLKAQSKPSHGRLYLFSQPDFTLPVNTCRYNQRVCKDCSSLLSGHIVAHLTQRMGLSRAKSSCTFLSRDRAGGLHECVHPAYSRHLLRENEGSISEHRPTVPEHGVETLGRELTFPVRFKVAVDRGRQNHNPSAGAPMHGQGCRGVAQWF